MILYRDQLGLANMALFTMYMYPIEVAWRVLTHKDNKH